MSTPVPAYEANQEVRFAVVIYGGVSLAIYINGVVQEMLRMVRATAPAGPGSRDLLVPEPAGSEKVYRKLGQLLGAAPGTQPPEDAPVRTRFLIDILSGTSAGGINAVFLAKAIANNQSLAALERMWVAEGDIGKLINDAGSLEGSAVLQDPPQSLLNSRRMYAKLLEALDGMDQFRSSPAVALADRLDLFVTATDLAGLPQPLPLADGVVEERRHRNVFHFRHPSPDPAAQGSDFRLEDNPFLAYAARCTSAFPFAFEPMALDDIFAEIQASPSHRNKDYCDPATRQWERHYRDYTGGSNPERFAVPFPRRAFGDGGYLDNKPFRYAIETMLARDAGPRVRRKLLYVEPNPEPLRRPMAGRPDAIENSLAALVALPRYETIREDLERVVERNLRIERIRRVVADLESYLATPPSGRPPDAWLQQEEADTLRDYGTAYSTYERLKLHAVSDELAAFLAASLGVDPAGGYAAAIRLIAQLWREKHLSGERRQRQFLLDYDISYRLRRLRHVRAWLGGKLAGAAGGELHRIQDGLGEIQQGLQQLLERARAGILVGRPPEVSGDQLRRVLDEPAGWEDSGILEAVRQAAGDIARQFRAAFTEASGRVGALLEITPGLDPAVRLAREEVLRVWERFEAYDSAMFPILFGVELGEGEPVDIHRISPQDAAARGAELPPGGRKLRGQALGAFGAFLDETWRANDILWGRLDGAERLITILLPDDGDLRSRLIDEAHREIVVEYLKLAPAAAPDWKRHLSGYLATEVRQEPEAPLLARSATRSTAVTGRMLEDIARQRRWAAKPFARLAAAGRLAWEFVEVSMPRSARALLFVYWLQLLMLFALLTLFAGLAVGEPRVGLAGGLLLGALALVYAARAWLRAFLRRETGHVDLLLVAFGAALPLGLAGLRITSGQWLAAVNPAASLVAAVAGLRAFVRSSRVKAPEPGSRRPALAIQFARTWNDVRRAAGHFAHPARPALRRALHADSVFIGAYAVWFASFGWLAALPGLAAAVCDILENRAVARLLAQPLPYPFQPEAKLAGAPFRYAVLKWLAAAAALAAVLVRFL